MILSKNAHKLRLITLLSCSLLLVIVLAACGGGSSTSTSTPTATATAKPSPTQAPTANLTTYTGSGFTIGYPQGWKVAPSNNGEQVTFTNPVTEDGFSIVVLPNPNGAATASTLLNSEVNAVKTGITNPQTVSVPPTTTIGGDTWVQNSFTGVSTSGSLKGTVQFVIACDNHPANSPFTRSFSLVYGTTQSMFSPANARFFQAMLQSFKFTP